MSHDFTIHDVQRLRHAQDGSGAYPACASFSQYAHSWLRDGAFIAHAMDRYGAHSSARAFHLWVVRSLQPHLPHIEQLIRRRAAGEIIPALEMLPARFSLDGAWLQDGWPNFQLDGYGQWLWSLREHLQRTDEATLPAALEPVALAVARYVEAFYNAPCSDCWEEKPDQIHTSTLASIYGGLRAISAYHPQFASSAEWVRTYLLEHHVKHGRFIKSSSEDGVDANLIWVATPFEVVPASDPRMRATVREIRRALERDGGLIRYAEDEYYGAGSWPLLTDFLAWHLTEDGQREAAEQAHGWVERQRAADGALPEQVAVFSTDQSWLKTWEERWGPSASPLLWSHAMHLIAASVLRERAAVAAD